ncbi:MAG: hypothetical protein GX826_05400 [Gammaproteobacteria bacterium]|nr:hypothetical protein [Gammaproteobacteria bacterium]
MQFVQSLPWCERAEPVEQAGFFGRQGDGGMVRHEGMVSGGGFSTHCNAMRVGASMVQRCVNPSVSTVVKVAYALGLKIRFQPV